MANPSTVNATASGKEVIRRKFIDGLAESEADLIIGDANHIYTVLSIIVCERGGLSDAMFELYLDPDAGGTDMSIADNVLVPSSGTFVWTDRFAVTGTDKLHIKGKSTAGTAHFNVWCTYIDQQFAAP